MSVRMLDGVDADVHVGGGVAATILSTSLATTTAVAAEQGCTKSSSRIESQEELREVLEDTASCDNKDKEEEGKHGCLDDDLSVFMRPKGRA